MGQDDGSSGYIDDAWLDQVREAVLEPDIPITDPHHHLWNWPFKYEMPETLADFGTGHLVRATVHVEAHGHYRTEGLQHLRPVGETEYLVEAAEKLTPARGGPGICAGIVGHADVMRGAAIEEVLEAHIEAARGRFRGIRVNLYWNMFIDRPWTPSAVGSLLEQPGIRDALERLAPHKLSCDIVAFHPNLPDVARTAAALDDTVFIVNHLGAPMTPEANPDQEELTHTWRRHIAELAQRPNVRMKLGGWTNPMLSRSIPSIVALKRGKKAPSSEQIADAYRRYVDYCIDRFGPGRCMFESNFPVDKNFASYTTLWNAFKRLTKPYSSEERQALLGGTAAATYRV
jgi:predicted TIM-barrel fold metal-dependent hydrolase